jgi:RimJ/RimL family protein N-acetyltransferase
MKNPSTFIAPTECDTGEFLIRIYRPGDGAELARAVMESYDHLRPWMPWASPDVPVEESEVRVRGFVARYLQNEEFVLGVFQGSHQIGSTGFHLRGGPIGFGNAEIGMWIRASHAGQGLGTRVLQAMLKWGFEEWGWERLMWRCDSENLASARVAEKCGLTLEGVMRSDAIGVGGDRRDTRVYAMLRAEWR